MEKRKSIMVAGGIIILNKVVKIGFIEMVILISDLKVIIVRVVC